MVTVIYFFSATGNSMHVALTLRRRLGDAILVPVALALKGDFSPPEASRIGFVFPLHYQGLPVPVLDFIEKFSFAKPDYAFCVVTRGTPPTGGAIAQLRKALGKRGIELDAGYYLDMPGSDITSFFDTPAQEG